MINDIKHEENIKRIATITKEVELLIKAFCSNISSALDDQNEIVIMNVTGQTLFTCMAHILDPFKLNECDMPVKIIMTMLLSFLQKAVKPDMRKTAIDQIYEDLLKNMQWNIERDNHKANNKMH